MISLPDRGWVLDSSALIQMKRDIDITMQWSFFRCLEGLVLGRRLYFCRAVVRELTVQFPDVQGAWADPLAAC